MNLTNGPLRDGGQDSHRRISAFWHSEARLETEFTIQIEVDLQSAKEGVARVGFDLDAPTSFRMIDSRDLHEGIQKVSFAVKAKPVDWGDRGYFTVIVNMGPKTTEAQWTPTALAHKAIPVKR